MKFLHAVVFLSVLCAVAGLAATTPVKSTAKKSTTKVSSAVKAAGAKITSKSTSKAPVSTAKKSTSHVASKGVTAKGKKPAASPAPRRQLSPAPDRYKEIQQALIDKGYLHGEPTGAWDTDSVAAMQRFQSDQKETPTGKITAASLIGLGLGAKSAGVPEAPPLGGHPAAANPNAAPAAPPAPATSAPAASQ
jgi:hypothetical protein